MRALDRKLLRDLWRLRAQALAIALVAASGVATYVLSHATIDSLRTTQKAYYRDGRFAEVFASLKRAPEAVGARVRAIPGVAEVETRVQAGALLDMPGFADPVSALVQSLPAEPAGLNRLYLRAGRLPEGDREVAVNEAFAEAHALRPGAVLPVTLNGRRRDLTVAGIVLSPEYVYLIRLGDVFPDYKRYGVLWMPRAPLAAAQGMTGAFNNVVLTLQVGAREAAVIAEVDRLLARWGGTGAVGRGDQISHRYLSDEIRQLEAQARIVPLLFLGVTAFLLNIVLSRLLAQERVPIALLKAFGYGNAAIAGHYLRMAGIIVLAGAAIGLVAGVELGSGLAAMYSRFFRYPFLRFELDLSVALGALAISAAAALGGALFAVLRASLKPPAEGLRPEAPPLYQPVRGLGWLRRRVPPAVRMIARHLARRPLKSALTLTGIALAGAILTMGGFMEDSVNAILEVQFRQAHRADLTLTFNEAQPRTALHELAALPGVRRIEPFRGIAVTLRHGHRSRRLGLQGYEGGSALHRLLSGEGRPLGVRAEGLLLTDHLASRLGVEPGQSVRVESLEGDRRAKDWPVVGLVHDLTGYGAYLELGALNGWLGEDAQVSGAFLDVDAAALDGLYARLKAMPRVAGVMNREVALRSFRDTMGENILIMAIVNLVLASTIAVGVVYNGMRTALSERERELASLRVLGYTRGEASVLLLGEIGALTALAIPLGGVIGYGFCAWVSSALASDLYRIPLVLEPQTYAYAALVVLVTTAASAILMVGRVRRLDLVTALKVPQ